MPEIKCRYCGRYLEPSQLCPRCKAAEYAQWAEQNAPCIHDAPCAVTTPDQTGKPTFRGIVCSICGQVKHAVAAQRRHTK